MQAAQHRAGGYERSFAQIMPGSLIGGRYYSFRQIGSPRAQRHARAPNTWSYIAFAFALCGADLSTVIPRFKIDTSKLLAKMRRDHGSAIGTHRSREPLTAAAASRLRSGVVSH